MLKRISVKNVTLGMHIHALDGAWVDHPFWKNKFVINDPVDLKKLKESVIKSVVIDITKGLDVINSADNSQVFENAASEISHSSEVATALLEPKKIKRISASEEQAAAKRAIKSSRKAVASMFNDARMGKSINTDAAMSVIADISSSISRNESALVSLVRLKSKDDYTYMHSVAVCALMVALAKQLNLTDSEIKIAGLAGLLHDIGKASIPIEILNKPGALTENEFKIIKEHPEIGHSLLVKGGVNDEVVLDVCLNHHEKIDGTGYPHQYKNDQISLYAKMGAVCDVYDAVTSDRPYKPGWEPGVSLQRMAQWKHHFDDTIFKAFVSCVGIYPIGSIVKLKSHRLAVVIDQSPKSLLKPIVKVFFSTQSRSRVPLEILDLSKAGIGDEVLGHEDPVLWGIQKVDELWATPGA